MDLRSSSIYSYMRPNRYMGPPLSKKLTQRETDYCQAQVILGGREKDIYRGTMIIARHKSSLEGGRRIHDVYIPG